MRVLVENSQKNNGYYNYLLSLLSGLILPENIIMKEIPSGPFSFFQRLWLQRFIKQEGIKCIVQLVERKVTLFSLPQLIVTLAAEQIVVKKSLPPTVRIVTSSQHEKEIITTRYPLIQKNIYIVRASASPRFQPTSWSEKQAVKVQYTQGREYFMTSGKGLTEQAFTSLLKAFSSFKKWQHSGMKLVITGKLSFTQNNEWEEKMKSYKYREDVVRMAEIVSLQDHSSLLGAAYAFLHLSLQNNDVIPALEAMQCETPCISFASTVMDEYSGEAVLLIEKDKYELLGEAMISLYKDEARRSRLIEEGRKQVQQYTQEEATHTLASILPNSIH